jgi:tetratricopeptide (TPR) repeat protein
MRLLRKRGLLGLAIVLGLILAGCDSPKQKESKYIESGKALYESGDLAKASLEFRNALQINPSGVEAQLYLGRIAEKQRDVAGAAVAYRKASNNDPKNYEAHLKAGQFALLTGDPETAKSLADKTIALDPKKPDGHALRGGALMMQGRFDDAEKEANIAIGLDPKNTDAIILLASRKAQQNKPDEALALVDNGLKLSPNNNDLMHLKLGLLFYQKRTPEVVALLQQMVALDPKNPALVTDLANQLSVLGKLDDAEAEFKKAIDLNDSDELLSAYAGFLATRRSVDEAIEQIKLLAAKAPTAPKYQFLLEQLYLRANKLDDAAALMTAMKDKGASANDRLVAQVELARIDLVRKDEAAALAKLADVLKQDPGNDSAQLLRAVIMLNDKKYDEAISDARSVVNSNLNSVTALQVLAKAYAATGNEDLAITEYRALLKIAPTQLESRLELANLLASKSPDEALEQIDALIALQPADLDLQVQKAEYLIQNGYSDRAELIAQDLLKKPEAAGPAQRLLGEVAFARKDDADAIASLTAATAAGEPFEKIGTVLVEAYARSGRIKDAEAMLRDRIAKDPKDAAAMTLLAGVVAQNNNLAESEQLLRQAVAAQPKASGPYLALARVLTQQSRNADALKALGDASTEMPDNHEVALFTAITHDNAGDFDAARTGYEQILARWPTDTIAANNLAALIADVWPTDRTRLDHARDLAERFRDATNPMLLDTLGWVLARQGNYDDATILLRRSVSLAPDNRQIQYHYGVALAAKGLKAEAKQAFAKAIVAGPDYRGFDDAKKQAGK